MARRPVVGIVDAYSTQRYLAPLLHERGYDCIHVQATATIPAMAVPTFRPGDFVDNVVHRGDVEETLRRVGEHTPVALIAGMESGVEVADALSERLDLRTNGTALSPARRDKFRMVETIKAAGVRGAEQVIADSWHVLADWYAEVGGRVVVKPLRSSGNDGVSFCDTEAELHAAFTALYASRSALDLRNDNVLAQEYLPGVEYYVNTVSLDGVHYVCDVWDTQHLDVNGVRDLLGGSSLLARRGPVQDQLVEYTFSVLDALGVHNGGAHTELKLTPDGPCLIETGARICGADLPLLTGAAIGESQLEWTVDAYTDPHRFKERCGDDYRIIRHATCVNMVSPKSGTLHGYPRMAQLQALESYHDTLLRAKPGGPISMTINDFTYPMLVHLLHPVEGIVLRDYATARYLDGDSFYDVG